MDAGRALAAWKEQDEGRGIHADDRLAIEATDAARALVLERLTLQTREPRDLFSACARLGRLLADAGASPSLAALTIDGAEIALERLGVEFDRSRLPPARASVIEGYTATVREIESARARATWDYPACVVRLDETTAAVAAGFPDDDREALAAWAAKVASRLSRDGVKTAVVEGIGHARGELVDALGVVGVTVRTESPETNKKWLRLPWRK